MEKLLSSKLTYFYKWIFPTIWIITFGFITYSFWTGSCAVYGVTKWLVLVCLIGCSFYLLWFSSRLKKVKLEGKYLIVSDYRTEELIPLSQIEEVKETRLWNPKLIKLNLKRPGKWGNEIVFIAPLGFYFVWSDHPSVKELRDIIKNNRS